MDEVRRRVARRTGVVLEPETRLVGFDPRSPGRADDGTDDAGSGPPAERVVEPAEGGDVDRPADPGPAHRLRRSEVDGRTPAAPARHRRRLPSRSSAGRRPSPAIPLLDVDEVDGSGRRPSTGRSRPYRWRPTVRSATATRWPTSISARRARRVAALPWVDAGRRSSASGRGTVRIDRHRAAAPVAAIAPTGRRLAARRSARAGSLARSPSGRPGGWSVAARRPGPARRATGSTPSWTPSLRVGRAACRACRGAGRRASA